MELQFLSQLFEGFGPVQLYTSDRSCSYVPNNVIPSFHQRHLLLIAEPELLDQDNVEHPRRDKAHNEEAGLVEVKWCKLRHRDDTAVTVNNDRFVGDPVEITGRVPTNTFCNIWGAFQLSRLSSDMIGC